VHKIGGLGQDPQHATRRVAGADDGLHPSAPARPAPRRSATGKSPLDRLKGRTAACLKLDPKTEEIRSFRGTDTTSTS